MIQWAAALVAYGGSNPPPRIFFPIQNYKTPLGIILAMPRTFLEKDFFWHSYFEAHERGGVKEWVSKQSYLTGFVSAFAGGLFMIFLYFTVGSAVRLSYDLFEPRLNFFVFFFSVIFVLLLAAAVVAFFKDLFSSVRVTYDGKKFVIERPISVRRYLNLFFMRDRETVRSKLSSIKFSRVFLDFFSKGAAFYYTISFSFGGGKTVPFPEIFTTSDVVCFVLNDVSAEAKVRFGYFSREEVEKIADFFGVPAVYSD